MRKYLQITVVLSVFGLVVFLRQVWGKEEMSQIPISTQQPSSESQVTTLPTIQPAPVNNGAYKNGTYTGKVADAYYGNIQVQAVISGGRLTDVIFLQYPNDNRTSQYINSQADPMLKQEAIQAQSAKVDIISGASASSDAFQVSLADALNQAK
jgi:uncharacterized protein with FMN-binding domain